MQTMIMPELRNDRQDLSWLARDRHDLLEQLEWREQIPALMTALHQQN